MDIYYKMLTKKIEALLFSSGRKMSVEELAKLCRISNEDVLKALEELKSKFNEDSSLMLVEEGEFWKLTPKEDYLHLVSQIVTKTELSKTLMETLAIIAFKYPIKQADLIRIRTNKGYDHLKELEEMGYITRQKYGRTKLIKLTQKFFDYFSLKEENLKDQFKDFESIASKIEEKEDEIKKIRREQKEKAKEARKEVDLVDDNGNKVKLDVVDEEEPKVVEAKETYGELEVVDEQSVTHGSDEPEEESDSSQAESNITPDDNSEEKILVDKRIEEMETEDVGPEVEKRVKEIFNPLGEEQTDDEESSNDNSDSSNDDVQGERKGE